MEVKMKRQFLLKLAGAVVGLAVGLDGSFRVSAQTDPPPSWNDTPTKRAIVEFVGLSANPADRISSPQLNASRLSK
jgi:hypothetical protein